MSELGKSDIKIDKKTENQCQNAAFAKKPLAKIGNLLQTKN